MSEGANCYGRRVGAVIVRGNRIISTGYNGTPEGLPNCRDGGCERCDPASGVLPGTLYDVCLCVHAEENALVVAARFGNAVEGADLYTTLQPCFSCAKNLLQAKIQRVFFAEAWHHPGELPWLEAAYQRVQQAFKEFRQVT